MENTPSDNPPVVEIPKAELVDLVDSSGQIKMVGIPRKDLKIPEGLFLQIVICVIFDKKGNVLVHQRSKRKSVDAGYIDHACGGIKTEESPIEAVKRESQEETTLVPQNLRLLRQGVNKYGRYCYLFVGEADGEIGKIDKSEVEWVKFMSVDELREKYNSKEFLFVHDFFDDLDMASPR